MPNIDKIAAELAHNFSPEQLREKWEERKKATGFSRAEIGEAERAYWNKVWSMGDTATAPASRIFRKECDFEQARQSLKTVFLNRADEISRTTNQVFKWDFDATESEIIRNLIRYFVNDASGEYPLHKGLFVFGAVGTGKTEIMQCVSRWAESQKFGKAFVFTSMSATYTRAKQNPDYDPITQNVQFDRLFDEFGRYSGNVLNFGNQIDLNEAIIEQRYERWQRYGQLTHFIANAKPNEVETMFSPMIFDRLRQMCVSVLFPGKSKRK